MKWYGLLAAGLLSIAAHGETQFQDGFLRSWKIGPVQTNEKAKLPPASTNGWKKLKLISPVVNLLSVHEGEKSNNRSCWAEAEFVSENGGPGVLTVGSDDGFELFLNGKSVASHNIHTQMAPDALLYRVEFQKGVNRILMRIDNGTGDWGFVVRALDDSKKIDSLLKFTLQAPATWGKTGASAKVNDFLFRQLTAPKYLKERNNIRVRHGIITGLQTEQTANNEKFLNGSIMPIPDFVEVRVPPYSIHDSKTGTLSQFLVKSLESAARSKAPLVELSPLDFQTPNAYRHPGLYKDITEYFKVKYNGKMPEMMRDSQGRSILDTPEGKRGWNRYYFSYADPLTEEYFCRLLEEFIDKTVQNPAYRIKNLNLKFPSNVDWYFPIADEYFDYSQPSQKLFRSYLKEKYGSLQELNRRLKRSFKSFDEISAPAPRFAGLQSTLWYDWQLYRSWMVDRMQRKLLNLARSKNSSIGLTCWMTTSTTAAVRDGIILDKGMLLKKDFPGLAVPLTCFDFMTSGMPLSGELLGQLAIAYNEKAAVEPLLSNYSSFRKTFFNILRFPVDKVTWLYSINASPSWWPWIHEVMNLRPMADELHEAKLVQGPLLWLFSYTDVLMRPTEKLWSQSTMRMRNRFYFALQDANLHIPMLSDFSTTVDLKKYPAILLTDCEYLAPEMTKKLADYVRQGGRLILAGKCGLRNPENIKREFPLWTALGVKADELSLEEGKFSVKSGKKEWRYGKGSFCYLPGGLSALVNKNGSLTPIARKMLNDCKVTPSIVPETEGLVASFEKVSPEYRYLGFINRCNGMFSTRIFCPAWAKKGSFKARELVSGKEITVKDGYFELTFTTPWEIQVLRSEL